MLRRMLLLTLATILLAGCSTYQDSARLRMDSLAQHYSQFDLTLAWEIKPLDRTTLVEGVVKNVRYTYMYDLEIWVEALNSAGKVETRAVSYVIPRQLNLDEMAEFSLKLPAHVGPGTRLRFTYRYRGSDGGEGGGLERGTNWMQSFDIVVP